MDAQDESPHEVASPEQPTHQARLRCPQCSRVFGRSHHLRRHIKSHADERPFKCPSCRKGFSRIDSLQRHELVHKEPDRSVFAKRARACFACATARTRCTGDWPCERCSKTSLDCAYPSTVTGATNSPGALEDQSADEHAQGDASTSHRLAQLGLPEPLPGSIQCQRPLPTSANAVSNAASMTAESHSIPNAQLTPALLNSSRGVQNANLGAYPSPQDLLSAGSADLRSPTVKDPSKSRSRNRLNWLPIDGPWETHVFPELLPTSPSATSSWSEFGPDAGHSLPGIGALVGGSSLPRSQPRPSSDAPMNDWLADGRNEAGHLDSPTTQQGSLQNASSGSNRSSSPSFAGTGRFYVDGDAGRLPHIGNRRFPGSHFAEDHLISVSTLSRAASGNVLGFRSPETFHSQSDTPNRVALPLDTYRIIASAFVDLCCTSSLCFAPFEEADSFPPYEAFNSAFGQFFEDCSPIMPILHGLSFSLEDHHWLLPLSMAALGMHFMSWEDRDRCLVAAHEFVRRAILAVSERYEQIDDTDLAQAKVFNLIGLRYCGDDRSCHLAHSYLADLTAYCTETWARSSTPFQLSFDGSPQGTMQDWKTWLRLETERRTGYCIWLLDCMWAFHTDSRPLLSLRDATIPLPCQEVLWEADSALTWRQLYEVSTASPSLTAATQSLYIEKRLQWTLGEFSRIVLIHAIFQRTWEVESYLSQPLSQWVPTANRQEVKTQESLWLPGVPLYSNWRNAACDCLDVLHWSANAVIGATAGMEHPTVMHLHLSRIILLTPFRQIRRLALAMVGDLPPGNEKITTQDRQEVERWAQSDQYKARLAMIHAGVLFWHIRRYSAGGFYEPHSVLLGTLALWAYGTFSPSPSNIEEEDEPAQDSDSYPSSINLDRPADDELVQLFIRRGSHMKALITGVGNLQSPPGPQKVLREGCKLLTTLLNWGCSRQHVQLLTKLATVSQNHENLPPDASRQVPVVS